MISLNGHSKVEFVVKPELVQEVYGGEIYQYYPLGQYIVSAPGVCGGRPTFKYTRLEASMILAQLSIGRSIDELVKAYALSNLCSDAVYEAIYLASKAITRLMPFPETFSEASKPMLVN